jgi:malonyl-CoA/methylmalonyl-CoA synthetase
MAVQVEKSVEAMMLYLATLRAGYVFLPLNTAYQSAEIEYFIGNAEPAVVVCSPKNFGWVSKIAFKAGTRHVFTLGDDRTGSLLERAAHCSDQHTPCVRRRPGRHPLHQRHHRPQQGRHADARQHAVQRAGAQGLLGLAQKGDVLIHALPIFHVHGLFVAIHGALLNGSKMIWLASSTPNWSSQAMPRHRVHGRAHAVRAHAGRAGADPRGRPRNMRLFIAGSAPLLIETFNEWQQRTGHTILERYGMSETIMLTSNPYSADRATAR